MVHMKYEHKQPK